MGLQHTWPCLQGSVTSQRICDTVRAKGVSNVKLAGSLVAQIWRVDHATPRVDASTAGFPRVPSFKSSRWSSLESLEQVILARSGRRAEDCAIETIVARLGGS
jgi:hypothetical protein